MSTLTIDELLASKPKFTMERKRELYRAGYYKFKAPSVCCRGWSEDNWIQFIGDNGFTPPLKEPNNLRNRWRRYWMVRKAYGWSYGTFREWVNWDNSLNNTSYLAPPHPAYYIVARNFS